MGCSIELESGLFSFVLVGVECSIELEFGLVSFVLVFCLMRTFCPQCCFPM